MNDERLHGLIEAVNDTARKAQATMFLFLVAALYLLWILISSTDENLFLNGQLIVGQLNIGLSLRDSYIIGPLILFFLHIYFLFILRELRLKISRFDSVLKEECLQIADYGITRQELRDRLSASIFVQAIQEGPNRLSRLLSRPLAFLVTVAVPLGLLFAVDLSFVRFQSGTITLIHDALFVADLIFVALIGINSKRWADLYRNMKNMLFRLRARTAGYFQHAGKRLTEDGSPRPRGNPRLISWTTLWTTLLLLIVFFMVSIAFFATHPPVFDHETVKEDRKQIWRGSPETDEISQLQKTIDVVLMRRNFLDAVLCKLWDRTCRYLDVSTRELVRMSNRELKARASEESEDENGIRDGNGIDRFYKDIVDLSSRKFVFAKLTSTWIHGGNFREADLRGAEMRGMRLQSANFSKAKLQNVNLRGARLQNADLASASMQNANLKQAYLQDAKLSDARLQEADLTKADLRSANILSAQLKGAILTEADLRSANILSAQLKGAILTEADLRGANITSARLQKATLIQAKLQNAKLLRADLRGANLEGANLEGADLEAANLECANLEGANLEGANLEGARLGGARLGGAKLPLTCAELRDADLESANQ